MKLGYILTALLTMLFLSVGNSFCTVPTEDSFYNLLSERYHQGTELSGESALLDEFLDFRSLYPMSAKLDSVEYFMADLYEKTNHPAEALATYLKIVYVHNYSPLVPLALENLQRLARSEQKGIRSLFSDDKMKTLKQFVIDILDNEPSFGRGEQAYVEFLQVLSDAGVGELGNYIDREAKAYLYELDGRFEAGKVALIRGKALGADNKWRAAVIAWQTVPLLEPYSPIEAEAVLRTGDAYFMHLEYNQLALRNYEDVIKRFPADIEAARASMRIAEMRVRDEKYPEAALQYEDTAKRFPFPEIRMECYLELFKLYNDQLKDPQKAAGYLERHVSEFPEEQRTADVLIMLGGHYESRTKNYSEAAGAYRRLAELFPGHEKAAEYLYKAGELAEKKMNDKTLAKSIFQQIREGYPESGEAKKAADRLKKLGDN